MLAGSTVTLPGAFASELSAIVAGGPAKAFGPNPVIAEGFPELHQNRNPPAYVTVIAKGST